MDLVTFLFKIKYETYPGEEICIFGDSPDFGNWKYPKFKLRWSEGHIWQANYQMSKSSNNIKFKFVCHSNYNDKWEEGENRILSSQNLNGLEKTKEGKYILDCVWNHFKINFNIHYISPTPGAYMQVVGDPMALSNWQKNDEKPVKMELKEDKEITAKDGNKITGFWTVTALMRNSDKTNFDFEYRYSLYDPKSGTAIWEREPNRHLHFFSNEEEIETFNNPKISPDSCYLLTNSFLEILDVNFVANLVFNKMGDKKIYIGPYPQSYEDFKLISESGINSILNVQSDKDLIFRQINHELQLKQSKSLGIKINRYPIEDFNQEDLAEKLKGAGDLLNKLLKEGNTVYVHCTAGMSRAAATVIIYLVLYENYTVEDAANFCKKHRPVICPNYGVINKIASIYKPGSEMKDGNIVDFIPSSFSSKISQEIEKERKREIEREKERRRLREERRLERLKKEQLRKEKEKKLLEEYEENQKKETKKVVKKVKKKKKITKKKEKEEKHEEQEEPKIEINEIIINNKEEKDEKQKEESKEEKQEKEIEEDKQEEEREPKESKEENEPKKVKEERVEEIEAKEEIIEKEEETKEEIVEEPKETKEEIVEKESNEEPVEKEIEVKEETVEKEEEPKEELVDKEIEVKEEVEEQPKEIEESEEKKPIKSKKKKKKKKMKKKKSKIIKEKEENEEEKAENEDEKAENEENAENNDK